MNRGGWDVLTSATVHEKPYRAVAKQVNHAPKKVTGYFRSSLDIKPARVIPNVVEEVLGWALNNFLAMDNNNRWTSPLYHVSVFHTDISESGTQVADDNPISLQQQMPWVIQSVQLPRQCFQQPDGLQAYHPLRLLTRYNRSELYRLWRSSRGVSLPNLELSNLTRSLNVGQGDEAERRGYCVEDMSL